MTSICVLRSNCRQQFCFWLRITKFSYERERTIIVFGSNVPLHNASQLLDTVRKLFYSFNNALRLHEYSRSTAFSIRKKHNSTRNLRIRPLWDEAPPTDMKGQLF